jgi:hypothetical protein
MVMELIFEVRDAAEGGYAWGELRANVLEATSLHCEDAAELPRLVQLHYAR